MKNLLKKPNLPVIICVISILLLIAALVCVSVAFSVGRSNLATQQEWASGKESFDNAYEIAIQDKETPDKTLYIPKLKDQLGKNIDDAIRDIGQGATIVSQNPNETILNLTNESASENKGSSMVILGTKNKIVKSIKFTCNTWYLGYGALSFTDLIDNVHCVEKSLNEAGLSLAYGTVHTPINRASYTTYAPDGTTIAKESCTFNGNSGSYKWMAEVTFDYTIANSKGDLSKTVRTLTIGIS